METLRIREQLHQYIDLAADEQIEAIYTILIDKVPPAQQRISIEQYNAELEAAEARIDSGDYVRHEDVQKSLKK